MSQLDALYAKLLEVGFIVLRHAVHSGNREWIDAEIEALHNVPSLIGETNVERHRYYWFHERIAYLDWIATEAPDEAGSRMRTFYRPFWEEMEPLVVDMIQRHDSAA